MEDVREQSTAIRFVSRFDDLLGRPLFAACALGALLCWIWMGLTEGIPIFMDGVVDTASVAILLLAFAGGLFALGFVRSLSALPAKRACGIAAGAFTTLACVVLYLVSPAVFALSGAGFHAVVWACMLVLGAAAAVLILHCAVQFACLRPSSALVGFAFSIVAMFVLYFSLHVCEPVIRVVLFSCLPLGAALLLLPTRQSVAERLALRPAEKDVYGKGFKIMCPSFAIFFFAIAVKCAFEPVSEFGLDSDTSVIGILLISVVLFYLVALRSKPVGVFMVLKRTYAITILVLAVCIALAPLSLEPVAGIIYNADCVIMIMVLWLLTCFVAHSNEAYVGKVIALALASAAIGMAIGWVTGSAVYQLLGHDRSYPTIALACLIAVFSTIGFSSKSFPYLISRGEAAKKREEERAVAAVEMPNWNEAFVAEYGLSERETDVMGLLAQGYSAEAIAEKLVISYHTARTHIRNVYKKLDVHSHKEMMYLREEFKENFERDYLKGVGEEDDDWA